MSGRDRSSLRVASVEDADESGNVIAGTHQYAKSVASPTREEPNTRRQRSRRDSSSPLQSGLTDSDSTVHPSNAVRQRGRSKKEISSSAVSGSKRAIVAMRPAPTHANTTPNMGSYMDYRRSDEASYYGVPNTTVTPASSGLPNRRASYYHPTSTSTASRPPRANASFYASQVPPPLPPSLPPSSYPSPSPYGWAGASPVTYPAPAPAPVISQPTDYFDPRQNLINRFTTSRPRSAMGHRPTQSIQSPAHDGDDWNNDQRPLHRLSVSRKPEREAYRDVKVDDRRVMRPQSAIPTRHAFRGPPPPPITSARKDSDNNLFHDSPLTHFDPYSRQAPLQRTRRPSFSAASTTYDIGPYRAEVATTGRNRPKSYMGSQSSESGYEEKLRRATAYQEDAGGGPSVPLTAESLRKASRNGGSSRSTGSSGSHDESDFRQSATTRTTRSSANEEDVTIRVKGNTTLKVGGAEMQCQDGAEINIISRGGPAYRAASDNSNYGHTENLPPKRHANKPAIRSQGKSRPVPSSYTVPYSYSARHEDDEPQYDHYAESYIPPYPSYPTTRDNDGNYL